VVLTYNMADKYWKG